LYRRFQYKAGRILIILPALLLSFFGCLSQTSSQEGYKQEKIMIGIYSGIKITHVFVSPVSQVYIVSFGDSIISLINRNDVLSVTLQNDSLKLKTLSKELGIFKRIKISPLGAMTSLKIKPVETKAAEMVCDNNLFIAATGKKLLLFNEVDVDNYVAGVVEAETGISAPKEYYKIQAIMCRTFALESRGRHIAEGFDVCDREHCQVFKGRNYKNAEIKLAVAATSGLVLADKDNKMILAAYHSNCGGQTEPSENVWKSEKDYLKPVADTFCIKARNANWEKIISVQDWEKYLVKQNKDYSKPADSLYCFYQPSRKNVYELFGAKISLTQMRKDLKLNSTFFNLEQDGDKIILNGRGSGHGVGLCQQGAMEMAATGYSYKKILGYYFKGVKLVNYSQVKQN